MKSLLVGSVDSFVGKSALCAALGRRLMGDGLRVGFFKPLSGTVPPPAGEGDQDAAFLKQVLGLEEPLEVLAPLSLTPSRLEEALADGGRSARQLVDTAFRRAASGKDLVLVEGGGQIHSGAALGLSSPEVAERLDARVLLVARYAELGALDAPLFGARLFGTRLVGCLINAVPEARLETVEGWAPFLEERGAPLLAALPRDRTLESVSVRELAQALAARFLWGEERGELLAESLMVGAMGAEQALPHLRRRAHKAVITGGDRSDIQLAALETATSCLILTGNIQPNPIVLGRAQERGVPVLLVAQDTLETVEQASRLFGTIPFREESKVRRIAQLMEERFPFARLQAALED